MYFQVPFVARHGQGRNASSRLQGNTFCHSFAVIELPHSNLIVFGRVNIFVSTCCTYICHHHFMIKYCCNFDVQSFRSIVTRRVWQENSQVLQPWNFEEDRRDAFVQSRWIYYGLHLQESCSKISYFSDSPF